MLFGTEEILLTSNGQRRNNDIHSDGMKRLRQQKLHRTFRIGVAISQSNYGHRIQLCARRIPSLLRIQSRRFHCRQRRLIFHTKT